MESQTLEESLRRSGIRLSANVRTISNLKTVFNVLKGKNDGVLRAPKQSGVD